MQDETKGTTQGTPPGTGQSSGGEDGTTSAKTPKETYTRAEYLKEISDLKAEQGRKLAELTRQAESSKTQLGVKDTELKESYQRMVGLEDRLDELERQGLSDSPEGVKLFQEKQELRKTQRKLQQERADLDKDKLQHAGDIKAVREHQWEETVWEIAHRYNIESNILEELNLTTAEQVEAAAKAIAGAKTVPGQDTEDREAGGVTSALKTDSAKGKGGGEKSEEQRLKERYPTMFRK
jgi:hypothetical protein